MQVSSSVVLPTCLLKEYAPPSGEAETIYSSNDLSRADTCTVPSGQWQHEKGAILLSRQEVPRPATVPFEQVCGVYYFTSKQYRHANSEHLQERAYIGQQDAHTCSPQLAFSSRNDTTRLSLETLESPFSETRVRTSLETLSSLCLEIPA